ncbi:MAG: tetratricopeptide repeat protein [Burkholderiales bacterium]|nr:tetratricopeptide repeat protein [Burkholderiales bacterium]
MNKIGRNEPCPCGSGKKYKACCGSLVAATPVPVFSVADAIRMAQRCLQSGRIEEAETHARSALEVEPRNVDALCALGVACSAAGRHAQAIDFLERAIESNPMRPEPPLMLGSILADAGQSERALPYLHRAIELKPDLAAAHNRLGVLLQALGRLDEAVASLKSATQFAPGFALFFSNLGLAYTQMRNETLAIAAFEDALRIDPNFIGARSNLGILLKGLGRNDEALPHLEHVLAAHPHHTNARIAMGNLEREAGNFDRATEHFEYALRADPHNAELRFQVDSLKRVDVERPPVEFVRNLFNDFAEEFDRRLVDALGYSAPQQLANAIRSVQPEKSDWRILDLGCGTGLLGVELKPVAASITGIDLAPNMLAKTAERNIYDTLHEAEIVAFMENANPNAYDLVCSTDVFNYFGNLKPIFAAAGRLLPPGGLFAFSLEANQENGQAYRLNQTGRYAHSREGIESLSAEFGFSVGHFSECTLRQERKEPVAGYLFVLRSGD